MINVTYLSGKKYYNELSDKLKINELRVSYKNIKINVLDLFVFTFKNITESFKKG